MMTLTIKEISKQLAEVTALDDPVFAQLSHDERKGVIQLIKRTQSRIEKSEQQLVAFEKRFKFERQLWQQGIEFVAGVDEVGRGPLAGPVVAAAVILPSDFDLVEVNDSKQLSQKKREMLAPLIKQEAVAFGFGVVDSQTIDRINIYESARQAMKLAVQDLSPQPDQLIVDAMNVPVNTPQLDMVKADAQSISVSAASIIAKVYRDELMLDYAKQYPEYDFEHNAGYGTKVHLDALRKYGATPIHRRSFSPVSEMF
ncbi:ribonuclease HII [Lentilactobacillus sp. SPB1-3]|uniref:Ribonuclease HII n=1 Tax=Lentilactobacillus terminaliae TaxID=3003483 RepID=A0ACD5DCK0_9LACO|nr:ribonuclease HII [Lentilactobacillus sp. SPB1-3]MCZ0977237.1 ribonuclease HII [Lentilactobacillus sp. SPB1-3]